MTLTLLGDVFLGLFLTLIADTFGRRRILLLGSGMMVLTGITFYLSSSYWLLLLAAVFGVVSVTGTDFGPFRSVEESILSGLVRERESADVFTWYIALGLGGSSVGGEVCGRVVSSLRERGWEEGEVYRVVFRVYAVVGVVNAVLVLGLGRECEMGMGVYGRVGQEEGDVELADDSISASESPKKRSWTSTISLPTLSIISKLWLLLAIDSLAEGMAPYALTIYYMEQKFRADKSILGDVTSIAYFLSATSSIFAGSLARRFGLVNTMVFSHAPSSAAMLLYALPNSFYLTVLLLLVRMGLSNLDQAPRGAFIAAVARPEERTAVLGIAGMLRTVAAMPGPFFAGWLASQGLFGWVFGIGGCIRLGYDLGLYVMFRGWKPADEVEMEEER